MPVWLTYTILIALAGAFVAGLFLDGKEKSASRLRRYLPLSMQLGAIVMAYLVLRPGRGVDGRTAMSMAQQSGRAVMIELYSNW